MKKFDAVTPRPKYGEEGKVWWHRVGNAIENDKGMITIFLDSVPVPDPTRENKVVIMLFEPRDRDPATATTKGKAAAKKNIDDEIPF